MKQQPSISNSKIPALDRLFTPMLFAFGAVLLSVAAARAEEGLQGHAAVATARDIANLTAIGQQTFRTNAGPNGKVWTGREVHSRLSRQKLARKSVKLNGSQSLGTATQVGGSLLVNSQSPSVLSPPLSASFPALADNGAARVVQNPDTQGAVGPNHLMVTLNSEVRIQDRTGAPLVTLSLENWWASFGGSNLFNPRLVYDPYGQRWIFGAIGDRDTPSGLFLAVSQTTDPTGDWNRYFISGDPLIFASPSVGFNTNRIVVQVSTFDPNSVDGSSIFAFNKADLYGGGAGQYTLFAFQDIGDPNDIGTSQVPAVTLDPKMATNYLVQNWIGNYTEDGVNFFGYLRIYSISGPIGAEVFNMTDNSGGAGPFAASSNPWEDTAPGDVNFLPQLGSPELIYAGSSDLINVIFRDSTLWAAQTIFVPAGTNTPTHSAAQWWEITTGGTIRQQGRVEDPAGGLSYAYPSISINTNDDVLLGYSSFSASQYPSANYAFRIDADVLGTLRADTLLKAGEASYAALDQLGFNQWGQWSATVLDPLNDADFWTIQEYASMPSGTNSRWGTWWGRVAPPVDLALTVTDSPRPVLLGGNLTYTLVVTNATTNRLTQASGVKVIDTLPPGPTFVSATSSQGACAFANGVVSCDLGSMPVHARATITIVVTPNNVGQFTNSVTVTGNGQEINPANNTMTTISTVNPSADLSLQLTPSVDPVTQHDNLTYTIVVTNRGPSTAFSVLLTNTLPASVTFLSASSTQGTNSRSLNVVSFSLGSIANGASATATIVVGTPTAGAISDRANVVANTADLATNNNSVTLSGRVNAPPTIQSIASRNVNEDTIDSFSFAISDLETPAANLLVTAASSNPALIPNANLVLSGTTTARTLTLTPLPNQNGSAVITLTVTDSDGATAQTSWTETVAGVNDPPTLDPIPNLMINEDAGPQTIPLTGISSGAPNETQNLIVTASNSNPALLTGLVVNYSSPAPSGMLSFTTVTNAFGTAVVTVAVNDGGASNNITRQSFMVTVNSVNDLPTITGFPDPVTTDEDVPITIPFMVSDVETPASNLILIGQSSNEELISSAGIVFGGSGTNRTLTLRPLTNAFGSAFITITVTDSDQGSVSPFFEFDVNPVNDPPSFSGLHNVVTAEDTPITIAFGVTDAESLPGDLVLSASSSDQTLVPNGNLLLGGSDANRTLTITPTLHGFGSALITLTADDGEISNNIGSQTFTFSINGLPTISSILDQGVLENTISPPVAFLIGDAETVASNLTLSATSSNPALISTNGITFGGSASNRTVTLKPLTDQSGVALITITVTDGNGGKSSSSFNLVVNPFNHSPTISAIANRTIAEDGQTNIAFTVGDLETPASALTVSASSSNPYLLPNANIQFGGSGSNRTAIITPAANLTGSATITLTVRDADGLAARSSFVLTVTAANDPPSISTIQDQTTSEDTPLAIPFVVGDLETFLTSLAVSASSSNPTLLPAGSIVLGGSGANRVATITPAANQSGSAIVTITVNDGGLSTSRSFNFTVLAANDLPTISTIANQSSNEDTTAAISFTVNDLETPAGSLSVTGSSSNPSLVPNSSLVFGGSGSSRTLSIRPLTNQFGVSMITVMVADTDGGVSSNSFLFTVTPVNDAPTITGIANQTVNEDTPITLAVTIGDVDTPIQALTVTAASSNPTLVPVANILVDGYGASRSVTITPATNQSGSNTITLTVSDGLATASTAFGLTVKAVNDPPTLDPIPNRYLNVSPGSTTVSLTGITSGAANESQTLSVTAGFTNPSFFSSSPAVTYTSPNSTGSITFKPAQNTTGASTITVTVSDGTNTFSRSFTVYVKASSSAIPTITSIAGQTISEDTSTAALAFTVGSSQTSASLLTVSGSSSNPALVPNSNIVFGGTGSNRTVTVTPLPNQFGSATITLSLIDPNLSAGTNTSFLLTVTSVNDAPTISAIPDQTINEDTSTGLIPFMVGDVESTANSLTVSATSTNLLLVPNANILLGGSGTNRALVINPATNQFGTTVITVAVSDGVNTRNTSFTLIVNPLNDPPSISSIANQTINENTSSAAIAFTVADVDTPLTSLLVSGVSSNPLLIPNSNIVFGGSSGSRSIMLTPAPEQYGTASITVTVDDGNSTASTSFLLTVNPVNTQPALDPINNVSIHQDAGSQTVNLTGISSGAANENQVLAISALSSNPGLIPTPLVNYVSPNTTGSLTFTPYSSTNGVATITVTINDGQSVNNLLTRTFTVTINAAPTLSDVADQVTNEDAPSSPIPFTVGDLETPAANLTVNGVSSNTALVPNANISFTGSGSSRNVTLTPAPGQFGFTTITLSVSDPDGNTTSKSFVLLVNPLNNPPTLDQISDLTINEDAGPQSIPLSGITSGAPNENQILLASAVSSNPKIIPNPTVNYTSPNTSGTLTLRSLLNANGTATITVTVFDGGSQNSRATRTFLVTVNSVNDPPTLDPLPNLVISPDAGVQTINLTGISPGAANEIQNLSVTATSSNPSLIPDPTVNYVSPNNSGSLKFSSGAGLTGTAMITVTVQDDGGTANGGQNTTTRIFSVIVTVNSTALLSVAAAGTNVIVSWPTSATGFTLQTRPDFSPFSSWLTFPGTPITVSNQFYVTNPATDPSRFYRLIK